MSGLGFQLVNNVAQSLAGKIEDVLEENGYTIGDDTGKIRVLPQWKGVDFSLPKIGLEISSDAFQTMTGMGSDKVRNFTVVLMIFSRNLMEREQLPDFLCEWFECNSVELYDFNPATPEQAGWINFIEDSSGWSPDRIERHDGSTENISVLSVDIEVYREIL